MLHARGLSQDRRRNSHYYARAEHRQNGIRAVTETSFFTNGGTQVFTGVNSVPTNSLVLNTGTGAKPTTQSQTSLVTAGKSSTPLTPIPSISSTPLSTSPQPTPSSPAPSATSTSNNSTGGFISNHKLLLAGVIAGFVALVLVISIVIWFFVRRSRRKQSEEVARQSFVAGALLNGSKGSGASKGKENIPMGETALFRGHERKKGSRADDWKGLGSRDDRLDFATDVANDAVSIRSGGVRSPYTPPYLSLGGLSVQQNSSESSPTLAPPYMLTGAFASALSAEDDEEREQSGSNQSHRTNVDDYAKIERGPQMRVPQTHPQPHPYADPSVLSSAVAPQQAPPYHISSNRTSPTEVQYDEPGPDQAQSNWNIGDHPELIIHSTEDESHPANFLSFTPSTGRLSDQRLSNSGGQDYFGNLAPPEAHTLHVPPSPSSQYSQQSGVLADSVDLPSKPGPVYSPSSRAGFAESKPTSFYSTNTSPHPPSHVGLSARPSVKQTKQDRANNMRAITDLIAALDGGPGPLSTPSSLSPGEATDSSRSAVAMPGVGMWRAALGSSPTLGARQGSDGSGGGRRR